MKKAIFLALVFGALAASLYAGPQAILGGIKGKVEVKPYKGDWMPATEGMVVGLSATVSTGYDSTATLTIEKSTIVVKPLTRLTLDKLLEQSAGSVSASMFLRVGSVQAKVKASVPGTPQDFKVQSPYSTASVRGTEFEFDGLHLKVVEGTVRLIPGRPKRDIQPVETAPKAEGEKTEASATSGGTASAAGANGETGAAATGGTAATGEAAAATTGETTAASGEAGAAGEAAATVEGAANAGASAVEAVAAVEDSGFAGAVVVEAANESVAVDVHVNQQAAVTIVHKIDTGSTSSPTLTQADAPAAGTTAAAAATAAAATTTTKPTTTTVTQGVTITITDSDNK
jgi:Uncharacterized protein conserved in bacteria